MKRFLLMTILFALLLVGCSNQVSAPQSASYDCGQAYTLVSFNGHDFGKSKSSEIIDYLANLLREADLIVLQEVVSSIGGAQAVAHLDDALDRTGQAWDYMISDPTGGSATERFAFLWKTKHISLKRPSAHLVSDLSTTLLRSPYTGVFVIDGKELSVFSFHLAPTPKQPYQEVVSIGQQSHIFTFPNTILVGDFNLSATKMKGVFEQALGFRHHIDGLTSLKTRLGKEGRYLSSAYDQIYTRGGLTVCGTGIVDFVPEFPNLKAARKVSDHLPVYLHFLLH